MSYGLLTKTDISLLETTLTSLANASLAPSLVRVLEVGVHDGKTARGMRDYLRGLGAAIAYIGIDSNADGLTNAPPFPGAMLVLGDSTAARPRVPSSDPLDLLIIDGCHCLIHASMDFLVYSPMVRKGGYVFFHDVNPAFQGAKQHHAGPEHSGLPVAVRQAIELLGLRGNLRKDWAFAFESWEEGFSNGFYAVQRL